MPVDLKATNTSIRQIIRALLVWPDGSVRPANRDGPTGNVSQPFATVLVSELSNDGFDAVVYNDQGVKGELLETVTGTRQIVASVQFFREDAYSLANRMVTLLRSSAGIRLLNLASISFIRAGKALDLSQVVDTFWEERAQVELHFSIPSVEQAVVGTLATVSDHNPHRHKEYNQRGES